MPTNIVATAPFAEPMPPVDIQVTNGSVWKANKHCTAEQLLTLFGSDHCESVYCSGTLLVMPTGMTYREYSFTYLPPFHEEIRGLVS
jgi:hypothetical protein